MFRKQKLIQKQEMTAYQKQALNDMFLRVMEWLEKYVEINYKNEFPDWENRKQIHDNNIKRTDIYQYPEKAESTLSSQLHLFAAFLESDASPEFREELKQEFYKWISVTKINVNECPERLKHFLFGINEVFEKGREKIGKDIENRKREIEMDSPEYMEKLGQMFADIQAPMQEQRKVAKSLEGKNPNEVKVSGFDKGNNEQGEQVFKNIAKSVADSHQSFHFVKQKGSRNPNYNPLIDDPSEEFLSSSSASSSGVQPNNPQQRTNFEIIQDVRQNPQNWSIDEVITEFDNFGGTKQEIVLIHQDARLNDYNSQTGKLNFDGNLIYRWENFNAHQRFEIKQAKNISGEYLTNEEIKWMVREVKSNPSIWKTGTIDGQTYLIHNLAQIIKNEIGTLIHNKEKFSNQEWAEIDEALKTNRENRQIIEFVKNDDVNSWKIESVWGHDWLVNNQAQRVDSEIGNLLHPKQRFTDGEWTEIQEALNNRQSLVSRAVSAILPTNYGNRQGYKLKVETNQSNSDLQKDNKGIGNGGIFAIIAVVSALLIASVVVVKKQLNKKVKKR